MPPSGSALSALALTLSALVGGTAATLAFEPRASLAWRLVAGGGIGGAALGLIGFALAMRFGLTPTVLVASAGLALSPALLLVAPSFRHALTDRRERAPGGTLTPRQALAAWTISGAGLLGLWFISRRTMVIAEDGLYTGVANNIGDLPFHLSALARFAFGQNLPPEHPSFAGASFTYPFLTDFIGAMLVRAGADLATLIVWSTFFGIAAVAVLMHRWTLDLTGDRLAAWLAPLILLVSGGLGWWLLVTDAQTRDGGVLAVLSGLSHDYTITPDGRYRWGNLITTLLIPQRGLLLALPIALVVLQAWWRQADEFEDVASRQTRMIAAGILTGMLPLVHAHTFAVLVGIAVCQWLLSADRSRWVVFLAWALAFGLPQVLWVMQSSSTQTGRFTAWAIGWDRGGQNVLAFWLRNTGLFLPLLLAAILWRGPGAPVGRRLLVFYLPFTLCFIGPNLMKLAPWIWDNIKILVYWFVASVPLVAALVSRIARGGVARHVVAGAVVLTLTLAGALDLWRVASGAFDARLVDRDGLELAAAIARSTAPSALVLHAPTYNSPVILSGRQSFMGYPGHVWSHGLDAGQREADIRSIYAGEASAPSLLDRYRIDYVVVGPDERRQMPVNDDFFARFPSVARVGPYSLYRTRPRD